MARVNVSIPDQVIDRARAAGLNVSALATSALEEALDKQVKVAMAKEWVAEYELEHGPITDAERAAADAWLDSAR